ncbi:basic proline-rich protein-like [Zalophus californianus]|uniref:Basic proline-rich protein-like n=1 Tax=Zalophus californianus TaxID=9704 RepID=A0A6P9FHS6_ZALCA|nr:basic proline-rich protein-like [Zalophus californianus]
MASTALGKTLPRAGATTGKRRGHAVAAHGAGKRVARPRVGRGHLPPARPVIPARTPVPACAGGHADPIRSGLGTAPAPRRVPGRRAADSRPGGGSSSGASGRRPPGQRELGREREAGDRRNPPRRRLRCGGLARAAALCAPVRSPARPAGGASPAGARVPSRARPAPDPQAGPPPRRAPPAGRRSPRPGPAHPPGTPAPRWHAQVAPQGLGHLPGRCGVPSAPESGEGERPPRAPELGLPARARRAPRRPLRWRPRLLSVPGRPRVWPWPAPRFLHAVPSAPSSAPSSEPADHSALPPCDFRGRSHLTIYQPSAVGARPAILHRDPRAPLPYQSPLSVLPPSQVTICRSR